MHSPILDNTAPSIVALPEPYWASKPSVTAIKPEFVLWNEVQRSHLGTSAPLSTPVDFDDEAESRTGPSANGTLAAQPRGSAQEPPRKRVKGSNKGRQFARMQDEGVKLCFSTGKGEACAKQARGEECLNSHDLKKYLNENKDEDISVDVRKPSEHEDAVQCRLFDALGMCPFGYRCRFMKAHLETLPEGTGFQGLGLQMRIDYAKLRSVAPLSSREAVTDADLVQWAYETRGELNVVTQDRIARIRREKFDSLPITRAYLGSINEPLDTRADPGSFNRGKGRGRGGRGRGRGGAPRPSRESDSVTLATTSDTLIGQTDEHQQDAQPSEHFAQVIEGNSSSPLEAVYETVASPDDPDVQLRHLEKRRLRFEGGMYLAPLTTVGNLPFRRLCTQYGADITCGEMGLSQEYMVGNKGEWSLVRRHPSERTFGIQVCGSRPQTMVAATEMLQRECPSLDFIDVNLGCPIDLVVRKGGGSALLDHSAKLGRILKGMSYASGDTPITIKMRTGVKTGVNTTHKQMPKVVREWGVGAVTIHGRTQQQRYSKSADYDYIKTCVDTLRQTAEEIDVPSIPIFGNGDAYDYREYWQHVEETGVDGIMVARGALIKPWIFTELKERRDIDISSRERLDMIGQLASYGLEHWGSDTAGLNTARRFLCESLSFMHRYVPVGLLERLPARMNDRPYPYRGRNELETLLASDNSEDWVKISSMFLGPPPVEFSFIPKHKANAIGKEESNG